MKVQIQETLGSAGVGSKRQRGAKEVVASVDIVDDSGARHKGKEHSKVQQLKRKYEELKQSENFKKFSNSSYLTPEAASYLNELIKAGQSRADMEIVYAGQHSENAEVPKFKRKEKFTSRYKNRRRRH